ncbi:hypothetical protein DL767_010795 [Monosporascus sp. MG133]|nr:hypothetical protein DL767_010795 [Monosporascus sp. MG133]
MDDVQTPARALASALLSQLPRTIYYCHGIQFKERSHHRNPWTRQDRTMDPYLEDLFTGVISSEAQQSSASGWLPPANKADTQRS